MPWPKTLADEPSLVFELRVHRDANARFNPALGTTEVYAPCCGRRCPADCVLDVRHVPSTIVKGGGYREPRDHDWLCDGCRDRLFRDSSNAWTRASLFVLCGAPSEAIREFRIQERVDAIARAAFLAGQSFQPDVARVTAAMEVDRVV